MSRLGPALLVLAVCGVTARGQNPVTLVPANVPPASVAIPPEPLPMGYASLYQYSATPWAYGGAGSWGYWTPWQPVGYGLVWRPAHDGGAYPAWWSGSAIVLGPWPPPGLGGVGATVPPVTASPGSGGGCTAAAPANRPEVARKPADAAELYDRGFHAYWAGDYAGAVDALAAAAKQGDDARVWYYLALSHLARGDRSASADAARYAAALEVVNPGAAVASLERVQGLPRAALNEARSEVGTRAAAEAVLAARPNPTGRPAARPGTVVAVAK